MDLSKGWWIWPEEKLPERNAFARFIKRFDYSGGKAVMSITADSRYYLFINGERVGFGPVRAWPNHWRYDRYDISYYLNIGENIIAVIVNHFGEGNFQYIPAPAGLLAQIELEDRVIVTDSTWQAGKCNELISNTPRISVQEAFEEHYDARVYDGWHDAGFEGSFAPAVQLRKAADGIHNNMEERYIPFLTHEPVAPKRIVEAKAVASRDYVFTISMRPFVDPDISSNVRYSHGYCATRIYSDKECVLKCSFINCYREGPEVLEHISIPNEVKLHKGWNDFIFHYGSRLHPLEVGIAFEGPEGLKFSCTGKEGAPAFAYVGPFGLTERTKKLAGKRFDDSDIIVDPEYPTAEMGLEFCRNGDVSAAIGKPWFHPLYNMPETDVYVKSYTDKVIKDVTIENPEGLLTGGWATVYPDKAGNIRLCLDYGDECVGWQSFEIVADEGTIVDVQNFEFIQRNGLRNYTEGMNNSFRYICSSGRQSYCTYVRRGFR
ncbi:MAG TPA: alpha-L-rhamnosidase N-terminal domain-containing protein, partial [Clostridia bacterium]|nr:alpha-L-rhamnosidase N-terminal domain-containing protein [Clostridia bacterium]